MKSYQLLLAEECARMTAQINQIVDRHFPKDVFCEVNREMLVRDIDSNVLIKHSPSIVAIVEYSTRNYVYISENIVSELDITAEELLSVGLARALMNFEDAQRKVFLEVLYPLIFEYYAKYAPTNEAKDLHVSYNTLLKTSGGEYKWYYHQLSVLACDEKGYPRYALKYLSNIDEQKNDDVISLTIHKKTKGKEPELIFCKNIFPHEYNNSYSAREKEIIQLVSEGNTTKEIASKLHLSAYTVSTHRKNIARKAR